MNIRFKKVILKNFMSFSNCELSLENRGYTLVSGVNNNPKDCAKSNGSGKSALWDSIVWALTGTTIRGTKDVCNLFTTGGTFVDLFFDVDNDKYEIIRYKNDDKFGTNLKFFKNNEDKSGKGIRDTEKIVEQYLPDLTSSLIGSVIILGQGLPQRFTNNTPSGRKEILEKLSKSDFMIQEIKDKLSKRKDELNKNLRNVEDLLLGSKSKLSVYEADLIKLNNELNNLQNPDTIVINKSQLKSNREQLNEDLITINVNITSNNNSLNKFESEKHKIISKQNDDFQSIVKSYKDPIDKLKSDIAVLNNEIKNKTCEIDRLSKITDICPTCGQHLPGVQKIDTHDLESELASKKIDLQENKDKLEQIVAEQDNKLKESKTIAEDAFNEIDGKIDFLDKELKDLESKKLKIQSDIYNIDVELQKYEIICEQYITSKSKLEIDIKNTKESIESINQNILYNNIEKDKVEKHLEIVSKMLTIATRDFRGYLLSEVISFINNKAKEYALSIIDNDSINFVLEGNDINISYCGKTYESLSGGEKQKVDLIIQFSIRDMLSKFLNFTSNILALDEIFDQLDVQGSQRVLNLISDKLIDIESIFIITHHANELSIPYDNEIVVIKNEKGISEIQ